MGKEAPAMIFGFAALGVLTVFFVMFVFSSPDEFEKRCASHNGIVVKTGQSIDGQWRVCIAKDALR